MNNEENKKNLKTPNKPNWCPGCGDLAIWTAFKNAAAEKDWNNHNTAFVAGVGCHGHMVNFVRLTALEGLHGRALPVASGLKMANSDLNVFVFSGDGDGLAEGGNHFLHTARRNHDLTMLLHDNAVYGLTTGQTSPRSPKGYISKSTPDGSFEEPLHPLTLAIAVGASFVARAYSGDIEYLTKLIIEANEHKGFALIDILQPCVTFNKMYSHIFYQRNTYYLDENYDFTNKMAALEKSMEWEENRIPLGVFYKVDAPSYESQIPQIKDTALVKQNMSKRDISELLEKLS
ncbi:MAG: thiamine pyrophosphate-dependent enzyme [Patescibacteria group bacterium]